MGWDGMEWMGWDEVEWKKALKMSLLNLLPVANLRYQLSFHSFFVNPPLQKLRNVSIKAYQSTLLSKNYQFEVDGSSAMICYILCLT